MDRPHKHSISVKGDEKRTRIIASARKLFEEQGIRKTSVSAITDDADITRALFYYYFRDKEDVVRYVLAQYEDEAVQRLKVEALRFEQGRGTLEDVIHALRSTIYDEDGNKLNVYCIMLESKQLGAMLVSLVSRFAGIFSSMPKYVARAKMLEVDPKLMAESMTIACMGMLSMHPDLSDEQIAFLMRKNLSLPSE